MPLNPPSAFRNWQRYWWIKEKYFTTVGGDNWVFQGTVEGKEGKPQPVSLLKASSVPIKRHTKIQGEANPYDPAWEKYFERRSDVKMEATLKGRRQLLTLYITGCKFWQSL